jgi:hypothetical protein
MDPPFAVASKKPKPENRYDDGAGAIRRTLLWEEESKKYAVRRVLLTIWRRWIFPKPCFSVLRLRAHKTGILHELRTNVALTFSPSPAA